jgi:hypothetical protein
MAKTRVERATAALYRYQDLTPLRSADADANRPPLDLTVKVSVIKAQTPTWLTAKNKLK